MQVDQPSATCLAPVPTSGEVTFYLSLPGSTGLCDAAAKVATPGESNYRHFSSLAAAARQFGATDTQINTIAKSVHTLGLQFAADSPVSPHAACGPAGGRN